MKKIFIALALLLSTMLVGCTQPVPPGYVAKIVGIEGVQPDVYETGRVRIMPWSRDRLVLIETASQLRQAPVRVIMADHFVNEAGEAEQRMGLEMDFLVNIRYRLRTNDQILTAMLKDMKLGSNVDEIAVQQVYEKYGAMVIGRVSREVLGAYTPETVLENLAAINKTLDYKVKEALEDSPLLISSVSLGPVTMPGVITARINANKDTELSEAQKRAQQKIDLLNKQNEIELARQQAVREEIDAQSLANQNAILNKTITPEVLRLRELQIREKEIEMMERALASGKNNTVFIPYGAVDNPGAQMRMFAK